MRHDQITRNKEKFMMRSISGMVAVVGMLVFGAAGQAAQVTWFGPSQAATSTAQKTSAVTRAIKDQERIGHSPGCF